MTIAIISLFPEIFNNLYGLIQTARDNKIIHLDVVDLRNFGLGKHKKVDDQVYGGSDGMLLMPEVLKSAVDSVKLNPRFKNAKVIALTPKGKRWTQHMAKSWSQDPTPKVLICGRYAGFDQRFLDSTCDEEISIGDFILNGGEVAALAIIESVGRLLPEVLGNVLSATEDSFSHNGMLEAPQYTRPSDWNNLKVPEILMSGNHQLIFEWKNAMSYAETFFRRPDLIQLQNQIDFKKSIKNNLVFESLKVFYSQEDILKLKDSCEV